MSQIENEPSEYAPFYHFRDAVYADRETAQRLLEADSTLIDRTNSIGETALHFLAVENALSSVEWLLERGANINTHNHFGETPLMNAAALGYIEMCSFLIEHGTVITTRDEEGDSALSKAAEQGELRIVQLLLDHLDESIDINTCFDNLTAELVIKAGGDIAEILTKRGLKIEEVR